MNEQAQQIDLWARANIPGYNVQGATAKLSIRAMIRQAMAYEINDARILVNIAKLFIRTNVEIYFSQSATWNKNKDSKEKSTNLSSYTYNKAIYLHPSLSVPTNKTLVHELTRGQEYDFGTWSVMTLDGTNEW